MPTRTPPTPTPPVAAPNDAEGIALTEIRATSISNASKATLIGVFWLLTASVMVLLAAGQSAALLPDPLAPGLEDGLEKASPWRPLALGAAWTFLRPLGAAAENAFQGRDGWLFYRPDVEHLTGPPFDPGPPVEAITQLHRQLKARGIHLLVVPIPVKPSIYPEKLAVSRAALVSAASPLATMPTLSLSSLASVNQSSPSEALAKEGPSRPLGWVRSGVSQIWLGASRTPINQLPMSELAAASQEQGSRTIRSPSFSLFIRELRKRGVQVIDLGPPLIEAKDDAFRLSSPDGVEGYLPESLYLATDTHWSPAGLDVASRRIAQSVTRLLPSAAPSDVSGPGPLRYQRNPLQVAALGDTARLLAAGRARSADFETAIIHQVADAQGNLWRPTPAAPILLLGDSFSNIYTLGDMGWGTSAGLPAQLSYHTGHPIDTLIQNDQGASATRQQLLDRLRSNALPPQTRLVIYQFAARELSFGDWRTSH